MKRKVPLITGQVYHICNKSIAGYIIYNNGSEFERMIETIKFYQEKNTPVSFHHWLKMKKMNNPRLTEIKKSDKKNLVKIIAWCLMPTHFHLIVQQLVDSGISEFMGNIQNCYAKYFNIKHKRKGPLWVGPFKNIIIKTNEQLLHMTRYLHLNPVTAGLIDDMEEWEYSSYKEYLLKIEKENKICKFDDLIDISPKLYKKFCKNRIAYQKELSKIKDMLLE
jgi:putative transposase